jgi:small subunit ribosomal protein S6
MEKNMEKTIGKYELLYIVHPDLEASIDKITDRVRSLITARGGKVTYEENWGKRKLAYEIKKSDVGIYLLWFFEAPKDGLSKIERDLRLTEEVIRYMLLSTAEKKARPAKKEAKKEVAEEVTEKTEKAVKAEPKTPTKATAKKAPAKKKEEPVKEESEEERMKTLDEKLGAILGDEDDNKEDKGKETK